MQSYNKAIKRQNKNIFFVSEANATQWQLIYNVKISSMFDGQGVQIFG